MALTKFNTQVDLGIGGIQTGVSPEKVLPGGLQQLRNADLSVPGRIQKRRAFSTSLPNDVTNTVYDKIYSVFNSEKACYRIVDNRSLPSGTLYTGSWFKTPTSISKRMTYGHRVLQKLTNPDAKSTIPYWYTVGAMPTAITTDIVSGSVGASISISDPSNTKNATSNNPLQATCGYASYSGRNYVCYGLLSAPTGVTTERTVVFNVTDYDTKESVAQLILPIGNYAGDIDVTPSYDGRYFFCCWYDYAVTIRYCRAFDATTGSFVSTTVQLFTAATVGSTIASTKTSLVVAYQGAAGTLTVRKYSFSKAAGGSGAAPAADFTYSAALVGTFVCFPKIDAYTDYGNQEHVGVFWQENRAGNLYVCGQMMDSSLVAVGATTATLIGAVATNIGQDVLSKTVSIPFDTNAGGTITNSKGQSLVMYQILDTGAGVSPNYFVLMYFFGENAGVITFESVGTTENLRLSCNPFSCANALHGTNNRYKGRPGAVDDNYFLATRPAPSGVEDQSVYLMQYSFNHTNSVAPFFSSGYIRCVAKFDRIANLSNTGNDQPWSAKVAILNSSEEEVLAPIGSPGVFFDFYKIALNSKMLGDVITDSYKDVSNGGFALQINEMSCLEREPLSIEGGLRLTGSAGGALTPTGVYQVCVVKRIEYASGLVCRGAPSAPKTITLGGAQTKITVSVESANNISNTASYGDNFTITYEIYRTTNAGTTFYLENSVASDFPYYYAPLNSLFVTISDANIINNPILYTAGGTIENITAPNITSITKYKGRVVAAVGQAEPVIWPSKEQSNSSVGQFTDVFKLPIPVRGVDVTCVRELDDKLIIFGKDSIYYTYGDGPNDTGTSGSFAPPIKISENVGCISNKAIARLDNKIIFRGKEGFYFLNSNLSIEKISLPVAYFASLGNFEVTSTVQLDNRKQVQFYLSNGYRLVYFTDYEQWSCDNVGISLAAKYEEYVVAVKKTGNTYSDLEMYMESTSDSPASWTYSDAIGGYYSLEIKTGWITFNGLQSLARVWRMILLGRAYTNCTLKVGFSYDYNPAVVDIHDLTVDTSTTLSYPDSDLYETLQPSVSSSIPTLQRRIHMPRQKMEAVQITIWDTSQTGTGKSFELNQITFEVGLRQGIMRLGEAQSS